MQCQICHKRPANVQFHLMINGHHKHLQLCSECYQREKDKVASNFGGMSMNFNPFQGFSFDEFFNGFGSASGPFSFMSADGVATEQRNTDRGGGFLDKFGRNLTNMARTGLIDPVIGRDKEIRKVIEILNRRNKNNPVLIGEPGVGKTAIVEGLALKIAEGDVPEKLKNKEVYLLDVASLVANTGIRGQFEDRMKRIIAELQKRKNIILFIDEIHLLVGAGSAEGSQMDAGNILKPALARGELQLVGATTLKEYRKIEKDGALERRFQPVIVHEPTVDEAIQILKGLKENYEKFHHVRYTDKAIEACVKLSHRYIQDRFLPDKAIDLMDEAGSKANLTINYADEQTLQERLAKISKEKEKAAEEENYELAAKLRYEEIQLEKQLKNAASQEKPVIDEADIQQIIAEKTGIPVGKLQSDEKIMIKHLEEELAAKVIGQEEAVKKVAKAIRRSRAGLKAKHRPIGSFLFVGPTGVGKTELAKRLAESLFGSKDAMIRLDMSEYMEKHSVSKLIGSPPGYVGFEEAGQLTEKVRRNPYCIILLDEIEKAHPDVQHIFLQILEDGRLTDSQGRTVSFKDTVIIATSNAGSLEKKIAVGFGNTAQRLSALEILNNYFKPEFLNRWDAIIEFKPLEKEHLLTIVDIMLQEVKNNLLEQDIQLEVTPRAKERLAEIGYHPDFGARPLRRAIQEHVEDPIADRLLDEKGPVGSITIDVDGNNNITVAANAKTA
ncbi:MAG: ATP-dependent Clp protease ATP-binding subunit [Caldibacillus debilis]|uniref:ATP-dependent Clp protease ATP-binding subunit n=1 Tax=Caldibacillus debilis TaxID=301148 RepID=A0A150LQD4_9BACI|nr:ATP-dependent Clp protease ATP-binding subunit [Caldibacillus debilis]KYD14421.1 hypothetical protein B4135_2848 [Caldibacillus debilis]REJ15807.1 MAG: ATP-dependent Clp protease ATP-binding subunit [Caldibacillus debilis]REJ29341.1 MAG: ATP-dependent Clp protease ATP-binding subunit [Caldibacillus debilis]